MSMESDKNADFNSRNETIEYENDSFSVEVRMKQYLYDPSSFVIIIPFDIKLYQRALDTHMSDLLDRFDEAFCKSSVDAKVMFFNNIPIPNTEQLDNKILNHMLDEVLTWSPTSVLRNIKIDRTTSDTHRSVADYHEGILALRNGMIPIDKGYDAPHVILTFDIDGTPLKFAKYFNGIRWCKLQMNDRVLTCLPFLDAFRYVVLDGELWYVAYDTYLCRVHLFIDKPVLRFPLPKGMPKEFQLCSDGKRLVLVSKHIQIAEVIHDSHVREKVTIEDWYSARPYERFIVDATEDFTLFDLYLRTADTKIRVVYMKSFNIFVERKNNIIYEYCVAAHQLFKQTSRLKEYQRYVIPKDMTEKNYARVVLPTELLMWYLNRFQDVGFGVSRKRRRRTSDNSLDMNKIDMGLHDMQL